ncbi:NADPH-dependent FMN reductase [Enterococcus alishanensis]
MENSDGVIFSSPEYDHSITSALKSILEWLFFQVHPLDGKPTMIVGTSYGVKGTVRSQSHLRDILDSPKVNAHVMFRNEFMLGNAKENLNQMSGLTCDESIKFLEKCFDNFSIFIDMHNKKDNRRDLNEN